MRPDQKLIYSLNGITLPFIESIHTHKRASQIEVGDQTELFGTVINVTIHTTGDAIEIMGDKDRGTVWKNTLIKVKEK